MICFTNIAYWASEQIEVGVLNVLSLMTTEAYLAR
jgi:hypothetical protein